MSNRIKVVINQAQWGRNVTASDGVRAHLARAGAMVAAKLPGATVRVSASRTRRGGMRARARVDTGLTLSEEADSGRGLAALRSVIPGGHATRRTRKFVEGENKRNSRRR